MVEFDEELVKSLLKNLNMQSALSVKLAELSSKQNTLVRMLLGDDVPEFEWKEGGEDFNETLAGVTVDGGRITKPELVSLLSRMAERLKERDNQ